MEEQLLSLLEKTLAEEEEYIYRDGIIEEIRENAETFDEMINDLHYQVQVKLTGEKTLIVQFSNEKGEVITTYKFYHALRVDRGD